MRYPEHVRVRGGLGQVPQQAEPPVRQMARGGGLSGLYIRKHCLHRYKAYYFTVFYRKGTYL